MITNSANARIFSIGRAVKTAIEKQDANCANSVAEKLRFRGWTYDMIYKFAYSHTGISEASWDELLREADI